MTKGDPTVAVARPSDSHAIREKRLGVAEKALGVATALLVLATAVFGVLFKRTTDEKYDLNASVSEQKQEKQALSQRIAELEKENAELRASPAAPAPGRTASTTSPAPLIDGIFRASTADLVLHRGQGIDLDSTAPDWGVTQSGGDTDLSLLNVPLVFYSFAQLSLVSGKPTYETCRSNSVAYSGTAPKEQIKVGAGFCVKTGRQRVAGVVVTGVQKGLTAVSFRVTVWD